MGLNIRIGRLLYEDLGGFMIARFLGMWVGEFVKQGFYVIVVWLSV